MEARADLIGRSAAIPGVLYFVAVGVMVHFEAARQGLPVPFSFAYDPALLLIGAGPLGIAYRTAAAALGIVMLGAGLIGYLSAPARPWERALLLAGGILLIFPGALSDLIGAGSFVAVLVSQRASRRPHASALEPTVK